MRSYRWAKDGSFTLQYKSATAIGKAEIVTGCEEKIAGLRAICQRFLPHHMDAFDDAMNIAGAFGGGMGNMEGTCGALVGSGIVLGLVNKDKVKSMKQMRQIMTKFQERNGATQCKLLKGVGTKVVLRECPNCVADAAEFLEELISTSLE